MYTVHLLSREVQAKEDVPALETSQSGQTSSWCRRQRHRGTRDQSSCTGASWRCTAPDQLCPRCPGHMSPRQSQPAGGGIKINLPKLFYYLYSQ